MRHNADNDDDSNYSANEVPLDEARNSMYSSAPPEVSYDSVPPEVQGGVCKRFWFEFRKFRTISFFSSSEDGVAPPLADSDGGYAKAPAPEQMYGAAPFTESAKF